MIKILVYVQHLLGIGHLHRTALITNALAENGFEVIVISGGMPESQVDFGNVNLNQLPAIKTDPTFSDLFDQNNQVINDEFKQDRCLKLIRYYHQIDPDVVLIETYPFGRRQMRFELLPLLDAIKANVKKPLVLSSIRDVIQPKLNPKRVDETVEIIRNNFDGVLVHGDESFINFEHSFPAAKQFSGKVFYTGYVVKPCKKTDSSSRQSNRILISAGGGAVGQRLYQTAIEAAKFAQSEKYQWHILVGNNIPNKQFDQLLSQQSENILIERNRNDFLELMTSCKISISQAGYNTIMDILITGTDSIVIPFEGEREQEQLIRAQELEKIGLISIIREHNLSANRLLKHIDKINSSPQQKQLQIAMDGAMKSAHLIKNLLSAKSRD